MSNHHDWTATLSGEDLARCRRMAESVIRDRRLSVERLESFRSEARRNGLGEIEEFLFRVQQSDQRVLGNAEQLFGYVARGTENEAHPRDHLVDDEAAESFPASDPPTYSRIT